MELGQELYESLRTPIDLDLKAQIVGDIEAGATTDDLMDRYGEAAVNAATTDPDVVELLDPTPSDFSGETDAS